MPGRKDREVETTGRENKYHVGQIINRWGKNIRITRIEWDGDRELWVIYGIDV